jgi:hypothetical protein
MQGTEIVPQQLIENKILLIRGKKVMLDRDLSALYGVETKMLNRAVRRNIERFPEDFMFELTKEEYTALLRCQFGTITLPLPSGGEGTGEGEKDILKN